MQSQSLGDHLRAWRRRRHMSQLDLALDAEISQKHLSFVESGRSLPSREMVLHLADTLDVPKREQNVLLVAAGYAPLFRERSIEDAEMTSVKSAVERVVHGHMPFPALAVDRHWTVIVANAAVHILLEGVEPSLLAPPLNALRVSLHPGELAPRIENLAEWRRHLLDRLKRQATVSGDAALGALVRELTDYPAPEPTSAKAPGAMGFDGAGVFVPLRLRTVHGPLEFISTTTLFGTPLDLTMAELAIESFFPATDATGRILTELAARPF